MTIRKRLARSNLVMILIPVAIAAVLLLAGGGLAVLLLKRVYLPRLGLSMAALHETGEQLEAAFDGAKAIAAIYGGTVILALLAAVAFTNLYLTRHLFRHIQQLPGISGSTILLIAGVYLPAIQAVKAFLGLDFSVFPGLCALGLGVLAGIALSIHAIRAALRKYRSQMVWLILGLMAGSLYAIVMGPAGLDTPQPPVGFQTFSFAGFALGVAILLGLELLRKWTAQQAASKAMTGKRAAT